MTSENRQRNVDAERAKGERSLRAATDLLRLGHHDDAVSRAYYAAYHHLQALLFTEGLQARTHEGVHDLFFLHFVQPGHLPRRLAKLCSSLQRFREQADYSRAFSFDEEGAREEVEKAREVCEAVARHLDSGS